MNEQIAEELKNNFSSDEVAQMITIMSLYPPLLDNSVSIMMDILANANLSEQKALEIENWIVEYKGLNERVKLFNSQQTMH